MSGPSAIASHRLAPLQREMLLAHLYGADPGVDVEQLCVGLPEALAPEALHAAFGEVVAHHPALRSALAWVGLDEPLQQVHAQVEVPFRVLDLAELDAPARAARRAAFLAEDRAAGFDLARPPLLRLALLRLGPDACELVWTFHHVLVDGRSFPTVLGDLFTVLAARRQGQEPVLPERPAFRTFVEALAPAPGAEAFWAAQLQGAPTPTPLPLTPPSPREPGRHGMGFSERVLAPAAVRDLEALAAHHAVSLGTVVSAAWGLLLARLTGERDVVFGSTRTGRRAVPGLDMEATVGAFINSVPLRMPLEEGARLGAVLGALHARTRALRPYEQTPLTEVQAAVGGAARGPLFQSLVMFETSELRERLAHHDPAWRTRTLALYEQPGVPLVLTAYAGEGGLRLRVLWAHARYDAEAADRLVGHLAALLSGMAAVAHAPGADAEVDALPLLSPGERERIVVEWNATARPFPDDVCIHELAERALPGREDAPALSDGVRSLTHGALHARANRLARHLRAQGVRPGQLVGVCLGRSVELPVALLAVLKSGAAYLPLDPEHPADRLAFMLEDAAAPLVLTERAMAARLPADTAARVLVLEELAPALAALSDAPLPRAQGPEDLAYVIYTSGSTGRPKGVALRHRAVVNTLDWVNRTMGVGPADTLLFTTSPCFDLSVYDVFGVLGAGGCVRVARAEELAEPARLVQVLCEEGITFWDSAPAALQRLVPFFPREASGTLRLVMLSGDWIPVTLPDQVRAAFPRAAVHSLGGATEAAIWSNHFPIGQVDPRWTSIPYGRPIQNARYHVLDARLQPVPVGVTGELYIGGTCLADGYLHRPELTAERFVADPLSAVPGERLYRTGDLARYFPDGNLEFLGRLDSQVKVRGYRVELGEVEAALATAAGVRDAVAVAHADGSGTKVLAAYVTAHAGVRLCPAALRTHLGRTLPEYMVPTHLVVLDALPLSANGKVDRKALPTPQAVAAGSGAGVAPRDDVEAALQRVWQAVFKRAPIGVTDDFFALGGHSLLAAMLLAAIRKELGHALPLGVLFQAPTIERLAMVLRAQLETGAGGCLVPLKPQGTRPPVFLVSGAGGHVFQFHRLARLLPDDQPLYAFKAVGADGERPPAESIEAAADAYVEEVLALGVRGPVVVAGYSVGGLVAFEVAQRLCARGLSVARLVLLDTLGPGYPHLEPLHRRLVLHARALLAQGPEERRAYLRLRAENLRRRVRRLLGGGREPRRPTGEEHLAQTLDAVWLGLHRAQHVYRPGGAFAGEVLLVRSKEGFRWAATRFDDPVLGWGPWVHGPLRVEPVAGDHLQLFQDENLAPLAQLLAAGADAPASPSAAASPDGAVHAA